MPATLRLLALLAVAVASADESARTYNEGMLSVRPSRMQRADVEDEVTVSWNLSPLYMEKFDSWLGKIGLYHVSVGFVNTRSGLNSTVEFTASDFGMSLLLPGLKREEHTISWNISAGVWTKEGKLDVQYWQQRFHIASIGGRDYNRLLEWVDTATKSYDKYFMFDLLPRPRDHASRAQLRGQTCFDVAYAVVQAVSDIAGPPAIVKPWPQLPRDDIYMGASDDGALLLDMSVAGVQEEVFEFYDAVEQVPELWSLNITQTVAEVARLALELPRGRAIFYDSQGRYWAYKPAWPLIGYRRSLVPPPSSPNVIV